jgi:phosphoribosyl 1,2-cyclic phosphodiesterase
MINFCSLYSGSTGNCLYINSNGTSILVDAGVSLKKIEQALTSINDNITNIKAILVTHEHSDHILSIATISNKYNIPVYANSETWTAMPNTSMKILDSNKKTFNISKSFFIDNIEICPFSTPHDAANPCGFNITSNGQKISIATDLGHITTDIYNNLENSSFVLLESNYDPEILKCSSYPYILKRRIASDNGHLTNEEAGKTICKLMQTGLKTAMLGHLSKENNFPELAKQTIIEQLKKYNYKEEDLNLYVANRNGPTELINVS